MKRLIHNEVARCQPHLQVYEKTLSYILLHFLTITITSTEEILKVFERNFSQETSETATRGVLCKKVFLEILQNSQKNTCERASFFNKVAGLSRATLFKKETLARVLSCEFCEISENIFFTEPLWTTA